MAIKILNPSLNTYTRSEVNTKLGNYYTKSEIDNKGFKKITFTSVTIATTAWNSESKTAAVNVSGVTANNWVDVAPAESTYSIYTDANIRASAQAAGTLTFTCETVPTANVIVNIKVYS